MNEYTVSEYESGWYVEKPNPEAPLEDCGFIQVAGPYKLRETAQRKCDELNVKLETAQCFHPYCKKCGKPAPSSGGCNQFGCGIRTVPEKMPLRP